MALKLRPLVLAPLLAFLAAVPARAEPPPEEGWSKEKKAIYLNLGAGALALGLGSWSWEWGTSGPRFQDEGWFGRTTTEGGADKLGHAWTGYALGHLFARQYEKWDFARDEAARYGALSSLGVMGLVELGDAFSDEYGFSYQDMLFNLAGAALGHLLWTDEDLARKVDFRVEYDPFAPGDHQGDVFTDYDRLKYLVAIKGDGFEGIRDPILRHLELHLGFYARGYDDERGPGRDDRRQSVYVGVGLNLTRLLDPHLRTGIFHYVQPPYTYLSLDREIGR